MRDLLDRRPLLDIAVRRFNPAIPHSLEAIVAKCLTLSPDDRYPDAGALARDLERFLNHQPLLKAANPSRRERAGNWLIRQRKLLAAAACIIGLGGILYAAAHFGPLKERPLASAASVPSFTNAVNLLEIGDAVHAVDVLSGVAQSHPQSCLPKLYLAFALEGNPNGKPESECESESEDALREAFAVPQAAEELADWAKLHPEVPGRLVDFVDAMMGRADRFAELYDAEELASDAERDARFRKPAYELAKKSLLLAKELDPSSRKLLRLLATTEQIFGEFQQAHDRLTRLIDSSPDRAKSADLFFCRMVRGRVAFLWIEHLRQQKVQLGNDHRKLLEDAINDDLNACLNALVNYQATEDSGARSTVSCTTKRGRP